jgi:hypothetical protein
MQNFCRKWSVKNNNKAKMIKNLDQFYNFKMTKSLLSFMFYYFIATKYLN